MMDASALPALMKGRTLCCAESCTGGMIGETVTSIPGSSSFFVGSAVTYSNEAKMRLLEVPFGILMQYGAVSEQTAACMAKGARKLFSADIAVAVTGIAGPGGATDTKPVGLVYIAVYDGKDLKVKENHFKGSREDVRRQTVDIALEMVAEILEKDAWLSR